MRRRDGTRKRVEISTRIIKLKGKNVIMGLVQDVTQRKQAEEELAELNRYNELKAEIWKLASDSSFTDEREIIQRLLDKIGPAMDVSRVSCLPLDRKRDAYVTELPWLKKNIKSSMGEDIGRAKDRHFFGRGYVEIPRDIDRLIKAPLIRQAVKVYASVKLKKHGVKSCAGQYRLHQNGADPRGGSNQSFAQGKGGYAAGDPPSGEKQYAGGLLPAQPLFLQYSG